MAYYRWCLWFSFLTLNWLFPCYTVIILKYFWYSRFSEFHSNNTIFWYNTYYTKRKKMCSMIDLNANRICNKILYRDCFSARLFVTIAWVSNYRYPIWTFCNWTPVIGYPRDSHVNHARLNGFLNSHCFLQFSKLLKSVTDVFTQKNFSKNIFNTGIYYIYD